MAIGRQLTQEFLSNLGSPEMQRQNGSSHLTAPGYVFVPRLAVNVEGYFDAPILLPEQLIRADLYGQPGDFLCMTVDGPSMSPVLEEGDKVLIDRRKAPDAEPGLFAVDEGSGLVVKWLKAVGGHNDQRYRVWTEDCSASWYVTAPERIQIAGRIVWAGRLL